MSWVVSCGGLRLAPAAALFRFDASLCFKPASVRVEGDTVSVTQKEYMAVPMDTLVSTGRHDFYFKVIACPGASSGLGFIHDGTDTDLKKLGALQRKFDDKELELHDHLDLSTACRFHLHLGLAQVAIGKDGKQHLDEAKKLADELADHDLIWLCDKHTRARASLEC